MGYNFPVTASALGALSFVLGVAYLRTRRQCRQLTSRLEAMASQANDQALALRERKHLDEVKDEFISTVSHELRTPLTSIRGALGLLSAGLMGKVDDKAANLLRIASTNTDRLVRLINDILDLERMDSGRAPMQLRSCSLADLIHQSVDTMSAMADQAEVRIDIVPESSDAPALLEADPDRIQQVLVNLLSNAIKFSPRGNVVLVRSTHDHDWMYVRVEDAGRGVPAENLETIFGRFNQVESGDARQKGGTGLGLAICRSIIAQHNGAIWAERNDSHRAGAPGTCMVIRLPRPAAPESPSLPVAERSTSVSTGVRTYAQ